MSVRPISVLIVDDSASVRQVLSTILSEDPAIAVMAVAADAYAAARKLHDALPDVIILDIEMPGMDGLTFLRKIMAQRPIPVIICSTLTETGSKAVFDALEAGAVDVLPKPRMDTRKALVETAERLRQSVKAAALARVKIREPRMVVERKHTADVIMPPPVASRTRHATQPVVCIGISTGGTESLREVLQLLSPACPGIAVVQHMPEKFTAAFARRLDSICAIDVKEAEDGDLMRPGLCLIAPGNRHMLLQRSGSEYRIAIKDGPPVSRHRPSAASAISEGTETLLPVFATLKDVSGRLAEPADRDGAGTLLTHDMGAIATAVGAGGAALGTFLAQLEQDGNRFENDVDHSRREFAEAAARNLGLLDAADLLENVESEALAQGVDSGTALGLLAGMMGSTYTMAREREIHTEIVGSHSPAAMSSSAATSDDLAGVLF